MRPVDALSRHASSWGWLVTVSAFALLTAGLVMAVWWAATDEERTATYQVRGSVTAITLDIGEADLQITGGAGGPVEVRRTEQISFNHPPEITRSVSGGVLRITSNCPAPCSGAARRLPRRVPDNVLVNVRTSSGRIGISGLNGSARAASGSGPIVITGFCGFTLVATSASGDVSAAADCSPDRMELRSGSGDVHAVVPNGRYRVDANSDAGNERVRGLTAPTTLRTGPGAERQRRRDGGELAVTAIRSTPDFELPWHLRASGRTLVYLCSASLTGSPTSR